MMGKQLKKTFAKSERKAQFYFHLFVQKPQWWFKWGIGEQFNTNNQYGIPPFLCYYTYISTKCIFDTDF